MVNRIVFKYASRIAVSLITIAIILGAAEFGIRHFYIVSVGAGGTDASNRWAAKYWHV